jgi:hypothetical protein
VHPGDREGSKGVYHLNAVDQVTQWQVVGAVSAITQTHWEPVLRAILGQFPFLIRGYHSDHGSEFSNESVAGWLQRLLIEQTQSRPRHSNDNGLVESKNGAVIRQHLGYGYIAAEHAEDIHRFYQRSFHPDLNFPRPCGPPERIVDQRGQEEYVYRRYATPWETLRQLWCAVSDAPGYLQPGLSIPGLDRIANTPSDTESAKHLPEAKRKLFLGFRQERKRASKPGSAVEMPDSPRRLRSSFRPKTNKKNHRREPLVCASLISFLQAHSWIRKCFCHSRPQLGTQGGSGHSCAPVSSLLPPAVRGFEGWRI